MGKSGAVITLIIAAKYPIIRGSPIQVWHTGFCVVKNLNHPLRVGSRNSRLTTLRSADIEDR